MTSTSTFDLVPRGNSSGSSDRGRSVAPWLQLIREAVEAVDYGTIQIKVHAGDVVQIETTRKIRVPAHVSQRTPAASVEESPAQ